MGFLSGIGKAIGKVAGVASDIGGIASGVGSVGGLFGYNPATSQAQGFAASSSKEANDFTREMMNKRHQWEVRDLRQAGLNPILSAHSVPSLGSSAVAHSNANAAQDASSLVSSAAQNKAVSLNQQKLEAEIELLNANATAARAAGVKSLSDAGNTNNLEKITRNLGNLAEGFHGTTKSTAKAVSDKMDEIKKIPEYFKKAREKKSRDLDPQTPFVKWLFKN